MAVEITDVKAWLLSSSEGSHAPAASPEDDALMQRVLDAVTLHVSRHYTAPEGDEAEIDDYELALIMQTARLWGRRRTPGGVEGFGDFGVVRVTKLDADVAELLEFFRNWGFA